MRGVIIQGSSRSDGNTSKVVQEFQLKTKFDVIDLADYNISHFDYNFENADDDFNALFKKITADYDTIIFATPVYWYTMSGRLKVFMDRISDFLFNEKDIGRRLRGKSMSVISNSHENKTFEGFSMPFQESANYLGMNYLGYFHAWFDGEQVHELAIEKIEEFINTNLSLSHV